jgi:hypothetical protein
MRRRSATQSGIKLVRSQLYSSPDGPRVSRKAAAKITKTPEAKPITGYVLSVDADLDLDEIWEYIAADNIHAADRSIHFRDRRSSWISRFQFSRRMRLLSFLASHL